MKLICQPKGTNVCGQCCVAMITGAELEDVIMGLGNGRTSTARLRALLQLMGYEVGNRRAFRRRVVGNQIEWPTAPTALLRAKWRGTNFSHWMVWHLDLKNQGRIYDPGKGIWHPEKWSAYAGICGRMTSYWPVARRIR